MAAVSLTVSTVKPLGDRIFIKVSASEEKTAGGILLPDSAKEKPQVGEVAQVGPGKLNDDGSRQTPEVSIGDKVLYSKYAGTCLLYTSPSPRDCDRSRMPSSA